LIDCDFVKIFQLRRLGSLKGGDFHLRLCLNVFLPKDAQISEGGEADCEYLKLLSGSSSLDRGGSSKMAQGSDELLIVGQKSG
jgi:hypothetical protein